METLPPLLVRHTVLPFLSSIDMLSLRMTCVAMYTETRGLYIYMEDIKSRSIPHWKWIYNNLLSTCNCGTCRPFRGFYYTMARRAGPRVVRHFISTSAFRAHLAWEPDVVCHMMRGAIESGCMATLILVRGITPTHIMGQSIQQAVRYNNAAAFHFLLDLGHRPPAFPSGIENVFCMAGINGNQSIVQRLLSDDFANGDMSLIALMAQEAVIYDNPQVIHLIDQYELADILTMEHLRLAIRHDHREVFEALIAAGLWVTHEDSDLVVAWRSVNVAKTWYTLNLPCTHAALQWIRQHNSP